MASLSKRSCLKLLLLSAGIPLLNFCKSPEMTLKDNKIEPILEKNYSVNTGDLDRVLANENQSVDDLFILAMDRSEKLAVSSEEVYQAREKTLEAWGAIMPQLSFRMGLYVPDVNTGSNFNTRGYRFYARQTVLTGLDEYSAIVSGKLYEKYTRELFLAQAASLYEEISQVYYQYLLVMESVNTEKLILENTIDLKKELERRYKLGKIRRSELLNTDVLIAKTQAQIASLEDSLDNVEMQIRSITGLTTRFQPVGIRTESSVDVDHYKDPEDMLMNRPDISSLKMQWELAHAESVRTLGGHAPNVYLEGSYRLPQDSNSQGDFYGGLVAEFPLFSGGQVHAKYLQAKSKERQAKFNYEEAFRKAKESLRYYLESWTSSNKILEMQKDAYEKALNNYNTLKSDYRVGQATNLEVLSALTDVANAKLEYEKTRIERELNFTRIRIITGELPRRNQ